MDRKRQLAAIEHTRSEIRSVLWNVWDPINMKEMNGPADEYDSYINGTYEKLRGRSTDSELANDLLRIVQNDIGYQEATLEDMMPTVRALRQIQLPSLQ